MMLKSASRCSGVARSSMIGCIWPLPSCSAPGKSTVTAKTRPSSLVFSKCPLVIRMPTMPLQNPSVGSALKSHGQPNAQLQFFIHSPSRRQSDVAMAHLPFAYSIGLQGKLIPFVLAGTAPACPTGRLAAREQLRLEPPEFRRQIALDIGDPHLDHAVVARLQPSLPRGAVGD